jgi:predicted NBD/HSP70 family sugar kinase
MWVGHLPYKNTTFEDYIGIRGFKRYGPEQWRQYLTDVVARLIAALEPDDIVLGRGNVNNLANLPLRCRAGANSNAFIGGFRMWMSTLERTLIAAGQRRRAALDRPIKSLTSDVSRHLSRSPIRRHLLRSLGC